MKTLAHAMMHCTSLMPGQHVLRLGVPPDAIELPINGNRAVVPYDHVRQALVLGWTIADSSVSWPPRETEMSPPGPLNVGDVVRFPDGSELTVEAPFHQAVSIPLQHVRSMQSVGWVRLNEFL